MFICIYFLIFVFVVPVSCAALSPRSVLSFLFLTLCVSLGFTFDQLLLSFPPLTGCHMNLICPPVCDLFYQSAVLVCTGLVCVHFCSLPLCLFSGSQRHFEWFCSFHFCSVNPIMSHMTLLNWSGCFFFAIFVFSKSKTKAEFLDILPETLLNWRTL